MLKVKLSAAPEKGKANESLVEFLADTLGVKRNTITITSGLTSPVKTIQISGVSTETILKKLVFKLTIQLVYCCPSFLVMMPLEKFDL